MRVNEALIGLLMLVGAVVVFIATASFPRIPGQPYGPDLFPRGIGGMLGIAGVLMIARGLATRPRAAWFEPAPWARSPRAAGAIALTLGAIFAYILAAPILGFVITAFILLSGLMLYLRCGVLTAVLTSAGATLMIEYMFSGMLRIPLPRGLLTVFV